MLAALETSYAREPVGSGVASTPRAAAVVVTNSATTPTSAAVAQISVPANLTGWFQQVVYTPLHAVVQAWIVSEVGRQVDGFINTWRVRM